MTNTTKSNPVNNTIPIINNFHDSNVEPSRAEVPQRRDESGIEQRRQRGGGRAQPTAQRRQRRAPHVGVAVDVYHLWWDPALETEIARCGRLGALAAFHVCDWRTPTIDLLNDRGLMGEGCIPLRRIRAWVEAAGFRGFNEVEIFSNRLWAGDQDEFLGNIVRAYREHV